MKGETSAPLSQGYI